MPWNMNAAPAASPAAAVPPAAAAAAPPPHRSHHRLRRDRANGMLGGVCAGVAETYGLDVTLVRVLWVIAGVLWIGVPAYIVAWIAIAPGRRPDGAFRSYRATPGMIVGLALVGIGVLIASDRLLPHGFRFDHFGAPLLLIGGGLAILLIRRRDDDPPSPERPTRRLRVRTPRRATTPSRRPRASPPNRPRQRRNSGHRSAPTPPSNPTAWASRPPSSSRPVPLPPVPSRRVRGRRPQPWPAPPSARPCGSASRRGPTQAPAASVPHTADAQHPADRRRASRACCRPPARST